MRSWTAALLVASTVVVSTASAETETRLEGYLEWRKGSTVVIDGQRVRALTGARVKCRRPLLDVPVGWEVKVKGVRGADGTVLAREIECKPNGQALFESDLHEAFDETEAEFLRRGRVFEEDEDGRETVVGRMRTDGPDVDRVRDIAASLLPPYTRHDDFRVYVVENDDWNAMAAPNGSIYVFTGLLREMDDDEVAIVLGHELAHATHEHGRKGFKRQIAVMAGMVAGIAAAEGIDNRTARVATQVGLVLMASAFRSGYGRAHEDQADRVGLRYAYEGGYDVGKAPFLWERFARKYGNGNAVVNFFFSDHSRSRLRAESARREIAWNYANRSW